MFSNNKLLYRTAATEDVGFLVDNLSTGKNVLPGSRPVHKEETALDTASYYFIAVLQRQGYYERCLARLVDFLSV